MSSASSSPHAPLHARPIPRRLLSLQPNLGHADLNTLQSTASLPVYQQGTRPLFRDAYSSPVSSPDSPKAAPTQSSGATLKRPGALSRAHSFCGDASANTFALACTRAGPLSPDQCSPLAPGLERPISSQGSPRTSHSSRHPHHGLLSNSQMLLTPPTSPPISLAIPKIMISHASPSRPSLSTIQPARPLASARPPPFRLDSGLTDTSDASRTTSYTISTPMLDPMKDEIEVHNLSPLAKIYGQPEFTVDSMEVDTEEDDMMVVDGMVHQVGHLSLNHPR